MVGEDLGHCHGPLLVCIMMGLGMGTLVFCMDGCLTCCLDKFELFMSKLGRFMCKLGGFMHWLGGFLAGLVVGVHRKVR